MNKFFDNKANILVIVFFAIVFVVIYYLNVQYPLYADDWAYTFVLTGETGTQEKVSSLSDIIISQYNHYMKWGGRSVVHAIAQLLLWMGETAHDILNASMFIVYLWIIYKMAKKDNGHNVLILFLIVLTLWSVHPVFPQTTLWITGSANYLWGTTIILLFIYPYYIHYRGQEIKDTITKIILFFVTGVLAGWTAENTGVALICFIIGSLLLLKLEKRLIPKWMIFGLLGVLIGYIAMVLAPGNYVRLGVIYESLGISDLSRWEIMKMHVPDVWRLFRKRMLILCAIYVVLLIAYIKFAKSENKNKVVNISLLCFLASLVSFWSMLVSPSFPTRATFTPITFQVVAIFILYGSMKINKRYFTYFNIIGIIVFSSFFCRDFQKKLAYMQDVRAVYNKRELFAEQQKKKGVENIIFDDKIVWNKKFEIEDISDDPKFWVNVEYARYLGVKSVTSVNEEK